MAKLQNAANINSGTQYQIFASNGPGKSPTFQSGVGFSAYKSADSTSQTGNGATVTIDFDTSYFDTSSGYSAGTFTALAAGLYEFYTSVCIGNIPNASLVSNFFLAKNGSAINSSNCVNPYSAMDIINSIYTFQGSFMAQLSQYDAITIGLQISGAAGNTITVKGGNYTYFCGALIR